VVNNIYLDSFGLRDYYDHVNGIANRTKTRIRWYGQFGAHIERPVLERKIKQGLISRKVAHPLPPLSLNGGIARQHLDSLLSRAEMPEMLRAALRRLQPSLVNRYQRNYLLSADGRFRLTVDSNIEFFAARTGVGSLIPSLPLAPMVIIELKFDPCHADLAAAVTNTLPFRLVRCSKYVLGIERLANI
jgi:hypothetical protein